jgi:hypothetical protein
MTDCVSATSEKKKLHRMGRALTKPRK